MQETKHQAASPRPVKGGVSHPAFLKIGKFYRQIYYKITSLK